MDPAFGIGLRLLRGQELADRQAAIGILQGTQRLRLAIVDQRHIGDEDQKIYKKWKPDERLDRGRSPFILSELP